MTKVLFICVHNSARSQIAEELLRLKLGDKVQVESAGLEPGVINPIVIDVLKSIGVDISGKQTRDVFELYKSGARYNYVITVCDESQQQRCPIFPGTLKTIHWSFPDPSTFQGSYDEKYTMICTVMAMIEAKIGEFLLSIKELLQ